MGSVEFDYSAFSGNSNAPDVVTTKTTVGSNDVYQSTFVITAGSENAMEGRVIIKAIDKAGNSQTFTDDQYMVIDRVAPNANSNGDISGATSEIHDDTLAQAISLQLNQSLCTKLYLQNPK